MGTRVVDAAPERVFAVKLGFEVALDEVAQLAEAVLHVGLLNVAGDVVTGRPALMECERAGLLLAGVDRVLLVALADSVVRPSKRCLQPRRCLLRLVSPCR
jgi:hypothetical protein